MNKKQLRYNPSRPIRHVDIAGIVLIGLILAILWTTCLAYVLQGNYFGYRNYYNQPVGTLLLLIVLAIITPLYIYMAIKTIRDKRIRPTTTPAWMNKPPWKFPWK